MTRAERPVLHRSRVLRERLPALGAALFFVLLAPHAARAQRFGRWWWDGSVGLRQARSDNLSDEERVSRFEQQDLRLDLAVNGFVLHPAVGDFRLALDLLLSEIDGRRTLDSDSLGLDAVLNLFPRGSRRGSFFFRRQQWDHTAPEDQDLFAAAGLPDATTRWGGRLELRRGLLRGTLIGVEHTTTDLLRPDTDSDENDRQFVDWSRSGKRLSHHVHLERRLRDFGTVDLEIEDLTANVDQRGVLSPTWSWEANGIVVMRDLTLLNRRQSSDDYRLRTRLSHTVRQRDLLEWRYNFALQEQAFGGERESQAISTFYRWRPRERWEIAPFLIYSEQSGGNLSLDSPRAGLSVSRHQQGKRFDNRFSVTAGYGTVEGRQDGLSRSESQTSWGFVGSLGHGRERRLRKELEAEVGRNELRLQSDPVLDLPDLDVARAGLGQEDLERLRGTLRRRWDSRVLSAWAEWSQREAAGGIRLDDFDTETVRGAVQFGSAKLNLQAEVGESLTVAGAEQRQQDVRFWAGSAHWRPRRALKLRALYRSDRREFVFAPDADGERLEAGAELRIGAIVIEATAWERTQRILDRPEFTNRGFRWSASRRFAGWLPVVTGSPRRGVIR